ncbi:MAG: hypothetical protein U1E05_14650 [Patescibacteria group bacterium]|nr:hypothetical protein [Patescibacteria group bacterium]
MIAACTLAVFAILVSAASAEEAVVTVDASKDLGVLRRHELYNNNSLLRPPSDAMASKFQKELGTAKLMRCWVTINDYWDGKSDGYDFDFPCGWHGHDKNDRFHDYMQRFSDTSEELMLNVRGYEQEVMRGEIPLERWRKAVKDGLLHYKKRYPKIKYVEACNEFRYFAKLTLDEYYDNFYLAMCRVVAEVNDELKPDVPLLVGAPVEVGTIEGQVFPFIDKFAADKDPAKRLDFISYHRYDFYKTKPAQAANEEAEIDARLKIHGLSEDIPLFITEMGIFPVRRQVTDDVGYDQVIQAAAMTSIFYYYNRQPGIQGMHWVMQHVSNDRKTQMTDDLKWTPYGASLLMARLHKTRQLAACSDSLGADGLGVYAIASGDESGLAVQVWNYQYDGEKEYTATVRVTQLGERFAGKRVLVRRYLIDSTHSTPELGRLEKVDEAVVAHDGTITQTIHLENNALCLIELTAVDD